MGVHKHSISRPDWMCKGRIRNVCLCLSLWIMNFAKAATYTTGLGPCWIARMLLVSCWFPTPFLQRKRHNLNIVILGIVLSLCCQIGCPKQTAKKCQNDSADMASTGINTNFCEHVVCRFILWRCFFRSQAIQAPDYQLVLRCQRLPVKAKHFLHAKFFVLTAKPCNDHTMEHRIPREHPRPERAS